MHYKTIALGLIEEQPELYERLRTSKELLPAMETYASELKASHEHWSDQLCQTTPGSNPSQIASEALEMAVQELKDRLASASNASDELFSLDDAMITLRRATPTA